MHNLTQININEKIPQIMHLIQLKKMIPPLGYITVLKSLILTKNTHKLISLPTPNEEVYRKNVYRFHFKKGKT